MSRYPRIPRLLIGLTLLTAGCTAVMSYDAVLREAKQINIGDGIDRDEAVLLAQQHVILTGLDQDVSVWHVAEARYISQDNVWQVFFRTGLDNKVGDRRGEKVDEVVVAVNAKTGSSKRVLAGP